MTNKLENSIDEFVEEYEYKNFWNFSETTKDIIKDAIAKWERVREMIFDERGNYVGDMQTPMNPADPQHYKTKSMECKDIIAIMTEGLTGSDAYYMGNIIKYLYRYQDKNGTEDLNKAVTYIGFLKGGTK